MKKAITLILVALFAYMAVCFAETPSRKMQIQGAKSIKALKGDAPFLQEQINSLRQHVTRLEVKMNNVKQSLQQKVAHLEAKINNLEQRLQQVSAASGDIIGFTKTAGNRYVFSANGAKIEIDPVGNIIIKTPMNMTIESGPSMHIKSTMLKLNNGTRPVARLGDRVTGISAQPGTPISGAKIVEGSAMIFVQ